MESPKGSFARATTLTLCGRIPQIGPCLVTVATPFSDHDSCVGQIVEVVIGEALIAKLTIEALDATTRRRLSPARRRGHSSLKVTEIVAEAARHEATALADRAKPSSPLWPWRSPRHGMSARFTPRTAITANRLIIGRGTNSALAIASRGRGVPNNKQKGTP